MEHIGIDVHKAGKSNLHPHARQTIEQCGHEVIVADPNYAPMYPEPRRRLSRPSMRRAAWGSCLRCGGTRRSMTVAASGSVCRPGRAGKSPVLRSGH